ncbi:hypothetical protein HK405_007979, partial [Cladochytrium tenue]
MILSGLPKDNLAAASAAAAADELASDPWFDALPRLPPASPACALPPLPAATVIRASPPPGCDTCPRASAPSASPLAMASAAASSSSGSRSSILFGLPPSASSSLSERRAQRQSVIIDPIADASPRWSTEIRGRPSSFQNHAAAGSALSHRHNTDSDSLALLQAWLRPVLPPERQPSASSASSVTSSAASATADPELVKLASRLHPGTRNWLVEVVRDWALDAESPGVLWLRGGAAEASRLPSRTWTYPTPGLRSSSPSTAKTRCHQTHWDLCLAIAGEAAHPPFKADDAASDTSASIRRAGRSQPATRRHSAGHVAGLMLDDPDASYADALEEAASALTEKSDGCFLWMALAFESLLHPGIGGDVDVLGDPAGGATVGGSLVAAVAATVAPVPPRPQVTFRSAVELLHAFETFPEGLDTVCLGFLSYVFPVPAGLEPSSAGDALLRRMLDLLACLREPVSISALADLLEEVPERDILRTLFRLACFLELAHPEAVAAVLARCPDRCFRLDPLLAEADVAARCLGQLLRRLHPNPLNLESPAARLNATCTSTPACPKSCATARNFAAHLARIGSVLPTFVTAAAAAAAVGGGDGDDGEVADNPALPPALDDAAACALQDVVGLFSSKKLLEWIELLSLMGLFNT